MDVEQNSFLMACVETGKIGKNLAGTCVVFRILVPGH
jgi:hypothetical protein